MFLQYAAECRTCMCGDSRWTGPAIRGAGVIDPLGDVFKGCGYER